MKPRTMSTRQILRAIAILQEVQRTHAPVTTQWKEASKLLHPLFREMARRQREAMIEGGFQHAFDLLDSVDRHITDPAAGTLLIHVWEAIGAAGAADH